MTFISYVPNVNNILKHCKILLGIEHVWAMTSMVFYKTHVGFYSSTHNTMAFTVISGGATGVDLEAES